MGRSVYPVTTIAQIKSAKQKIAQFGSKIAQYNYRKYYPLYGIAECEAIVKHQERENVHDFSQTGKILFFAGEIHELKQTVKNSENQITDYRAQLHNLEMHSLEKDASIEKYKDEAKHREGECE